MWGAIGTALAVWVLYEVLRAAIRNGINESKLVRAESVLPPRPGLKAPQGYKWVLVKDETPSDDMHAER